MVDDQYDGFVRNRSSGKDATSRSIIAAILLLLYPIMIGRAKGLPETSSLIQLPRSADHKTRVVISVDEFGAKGNGFDDDTLVEGFSSGLVNPPSCLASAVVGLIKQNVGSSKQVDVVV
ncbi:hypothetical protein BHM03_00060174 [Ensete ventricosum]|nr:hypothetical protein BHM03_00060174 [Ensete ventricosum]